MKKILISAALVMASAFTGLASAADGTISFTGKIIDDACNIKGSSPSIDFGTISEGSLSGAGTSTAATLFNIVLEDCPTAATSAKITFDGPTDINNRSLLAVTTGSDAAEGVAVGFFEKDSTTLIPIGSASASQSLIPATDTTLEFIAKYVSNGAPVVAGTVNASADFTVTYN